MLVERVVFCSALSVLDTDQLPGLGDIGVMKIGAYGAPKLAAASPIKSYREVKIGVILLAKPRCQLSYLLIGHLAVSFAAKDMLLPSGMSAIELRSCRFVVSVGLTQSPLFGGGVVPVAPSHHPCLSCRG
jgi:hypothetical protein